MQQRRSLEEYIESLMYEESLNDLITILSDTIDSLPIGDNIAGYSAGLGGGISNGGGGAECVGSYPVSGYTRSDGTEVSGYIRTCGAAHAGSSSETKSNNQQNTNSENDWDSVNPDDLDDVLDRELLEDYYNNRTPLLEGKVEQEVLPQVKSIEPESLPEIYSNDKLTAEEDFQKKLAEKLPFDRFVIAQDYYKISLDLANNPEAVKDNARNRFFKVSNLPNNVDKKVVQNKIAKSLKMDVNSQENKATFEKTDVILPQENSRIVTLIKKSDIIKNFVVNNYENIKSGKLKGELIQGGIKFDAPTYKELINPIKYSDKMTLFLVLHSVDVYDIKQNSDGSVSFKICDFYDFDYLNTKLTDSLKTKAVNRINNNAFHQQAAKKLKPYVIYIPVTISQKELEKMLNKKRI